MVNHHLAPDNILLFPQLFSCEYRTMKTLRVSHIVLTVCAVIAAAILFVAYETIPFINPFAPVQLNGPTVADSNGNLTAIVDTDSRRILVLNADNNLVDIMNCADMDSAVDAVTDVCVMNDTVYLSGVRFAPDSDIIKQERVVASNKSGNNQEIIYEEEGHGSASPSIVSLSNASEGIVIAKERWGYRDGTSDQTKELSNDVDIDDLDAISNTVSFELYQSNKIQEISSFDGGAINVHAVALSSSGENNYATVNSFGELKGAALTDKSAAVLQHTFTAVDIDDEGSVYACDNTTGSLCAIAAHGGEVRVLVTGSGYTSVHENSGVVALTDASVNEVVLCDKQGAVQSRFSSVFPSSGFLALVLAVWASAIYLGILALTLALRKVIAKIKAGDTKSFGPMFMAVAVVAAVTVAIVDLSYSSYKTSLESRASIVNMSAEHLQESTQTQSNAMAIINSRNAFHKDNQESAQAIDAFYDAMGPLRFWWPPPLRSPTAMRRSCSRFFQLTRVYRYPTSTTSSFWDNWLCTCALPQSGAQATNWEAGAPR